MDIPIFNIFISPSANIGIGYDFRKYHYFKRKEILLLSSLSNTLCFNTGWSNTLYNNIFFQTQIPKKPIWKVDTLITVSDLGANKYTTN